MSLIFMKYWALIKTLQTNKVSNQPGLCVFFVVNFPVKPVITYLQYLTFWFAVRKAYHKLSLKVHPDRVGDEHKAEATEKFKILGRIYSVLSNQEKRAVYDETGTIDDEDGDSDFDWLNFWKRIFKPLSHKDYKDYEVKYKDSEEEAIDLKKAYVNGKGDMDFILEMVPFTNCDDEPRLKTIIQKYIDNGEVPEYDCFVNESPRKAARRKRKVGFVVLLLT